MAEGDAVTKVASDQGVPMIEGDPTEPTGPEDAAGHGVKRGDYSGRGDGTQHFQMERDANGDVVAFDQNAAMQTTPAVPDAGEKGGVDSNEGATSGDPDAEEVQTLTIDATGGTFTLEFDGETTDAIAENASAATVQAELEELSNIDPGDVTVTGSAGGPYTITFGGQYENENVPTIITNAGSLTGGASTAVIATSTQGGS